MRQLDDWLKNYMEYTTNSEPTDNFRLWTGISVIAASLQRKCSLEWGTFTLYPNLYIVLVGPSGSRKGTAMGPGYNMLRNLGVKMAAEAITREALIRELKTCTNTQASGDKMFMHSSLTIFSQELTVFLGYSNMQLMADLCDWFDCRDTWTYRTKSQGVDEITGVWVNLFGATTPELIQTTLPRDAIGGGLTARMIMIYAPGKKQSVSIPHLTEEEKALGLVLQSDLEKVNMLSGDFKVSQDFIDYWIEWYPRQDSEIIFDDTRFTGYVERRGMHALKLSMVCNASRTNDMIMTSYDLQRAIFLLESVEKDMPKVFSGVGKSPTSDIITQVMEYCALNRRTTYATLLGKFYQDADKRTMDGVLQTLATMGVIKTVERPEGADIVYLHRGKELDGLLSDTREVKAVREDN